MKRIVVFASALFLLAFSFASAETVLRINAWENPATITAVEEINARFMEKYPDITVEFTHSPTSNFEQENPMRVVAGDVDIWSDFGFAFKIQDFHTNVNPSVVYQNIEAGLVEALDGQEFLNNYKEEAIRDAMTYNGHVYGVCVGSVVFSGVFYNKDLFAQYNLEVPQTYDELIEVAEVFMENDIAPFTTAGAAGWPIDMMIHAFLGTLIDDLAAFEKDLWTGGPGFKDPRYMDAMERYQNLLLNYYEDGFEALDYNPHIGRFVQGKAAMLPDGIWQATSIAEQGGPDFNFGYMPFPTSDSAEANQMFFGKYDLMWQVHSQSENKDAALKWLAFFSEKENYEMFINTVGWLPTQPDVEVENPILAEVAALPMKLAFEQHHVSRQGQGQYAEGLMRHLIPMGTIETVEEFTDLAQRDWEAAAPE